MQITSNKGNSSDIEIAYSWLEFEKSESQCLRVTLCYGECDVCGLASMLRHTDPESIDHC